LPSDAPSTLARLVDKSEGVPERLLDVGWGRGGDAGWFAGQGAEVTGYDYVSWPSTAVRRRAAREELPLSFRSLNLLDIRSWMSEATRLAHEGDARTITCRHVIEATTGQGRDAVWRFASMVLREGGRLYVEFLSGQRRSHGSDLLAVLPVELVSEEIRSRGGTITHREDGVEDGGDRPVCRLIVEWRRPAERHTTRRNR
jgi:2-polyprenyl-3-methyl-5-hydroxy-6-metoxy-1,4-benzoquinol methylase